MMVGRCDVTTRGDTRYTQHALIGNDTVYVLGDFATLGSIDPDFNVREQVRELLASWKKDHPRLLERFDLDGNGELDLQEWELARQQARREVERRRDEAMAAPEAHIVRRPTDGRLYLISDFDPERIARRYRWLALFHVVLFLAAIAGPGVVQPGRDHLIRLRTPQRAPPALPSAAWPPRSRPPAPPAGP